MDICAGVLTDGTVITARNNVRLMGSVVVGLFVRNARAATASEINLTDANENSASRLVGSPLARARGNVFDGHGNDDNEPLRNGVAVDRKTADRSKTSNVPRISFVGI